MEELHIYFEMTRLPSLFSKTLVSVSHTPRLSHPDRTPHIAPHAHIAASRLSLSSDDSSKFFVQVFVEDYDYAYRGILLVQ